MKLANDLLLTVKCEKVDIIPAQERAEKAA